MKRKKDINVSDLGIPHESARKDRGKNAIVKQGFLARHHNSKAIRTFFGGSMNKINRWMKKEDIGGRQYEMLQNSQEDTCGSSLY